MIYFFAGYSLDTERLVLSLDNNEIPTEPQVFDLLRLLVENAGTVVTKDTMMDVVWNGRIVSEATVSARINAARKAVGDDGKRQAVIKTVSRRGLELVVPITTIDAVADNPQELPGALRQTVRYTKSKDGARLAWASFGEGPALLYGGHYLTHLELEWSGGVFRKNIEDISKNHTMVRFDARGTGLSEESPQSRSLTSFVEDMEAVVEAAQLTRFPIVATMQNTIVALHYAARHPEKVSRLVLHNAYCDGRGVREGHKQNSEEDPFYTLMRDGFKFRQPAFVQAWAALFLPDTSRDDIEELVEFVTHSITPENAARNRLAIDQFSAASVLDKIKAPTLVIQARNSAVHPISEGMKLASGINGAEFLVVDTGSTINLPSNPTYDEQIEAIQEFLAREG